MHPLLLALAAATLSPCVHAPDSVRWEARTFTGTRLRYGNYGNTFEAVVEFGRDSVPARAVTIGGESADPRSPHFNDQAARYAAGDLRQVYFYPGQLQGHTERRYRPG